VALNFECKKWFFNTALVQALMDNRTGRALITAGKWVRTYAKYSMASRQSTDLHSAPGMPPYSHPKTGAALKRLIFYFYSPREKNVTVGPISLGAHGDVPAIHEKGFSGSRLLRNRRRRKRRLGGVGEIRLGQKTTTTYADSPHGSAEIKITDTSTVATYAKLRTLAQVARANRLNEELYGAMYKVTAVNYPARPYMRPALDAVKPMLPDFWGTSVNVTSEAA
jgi:hypothetical protein